MRILIVHNAYQQRGGEDAVVEAEAALLAAHGHQVQRYTRHNDEIGSVPKIGLAAQTIWSTQSAKQITQAVTDFKPDVVHFHNTFPLISPSAYWAVAAAGVPIVQTLHNFRLLCPQAMFLRDGSICEDCLGRPPWRGALRGCYRESRVQSTVVASMLAVHRLLGTWQRKVDRFIALSNFAKDKFVEGGLPAAKIVVKPNFVAAGPPADVERSGFLFVGRLSVEKGLALLREAASALGPGELRVAGDGPQAHLLQGLAAVTRLGNIANTAVRDEMARAGCLLVPSIWYEGCPMVVIEAFAAGLPVIAARLGALAEFVEEGITGLLFEPGNATDLAARLEWACTHPQAMGEMGRRARSRYEADYSPVGNHDRLISIYRDAIVQRSEAR